MEENNFIIGDVLEANNRSRRAGFHFIIYYDSLDDYHFLGAIITSSNKFPKNIEMKDSHFEKMDENGNDFKVVNKNSYLVPAKLIKLESWGPFKKVGELSFDGIEFLEGIIGELEAVTWEDAIRKPIIN